MKYAEAPLYTPAYDLCRDLLQRTRRFPKDQRFVLGQRIANAALDLVDSVVGALVSSDLDRTRTLLAADQALIRLRVSLRLARDLELLSQRQLVHSTTALTTIGRMVGGMRRQHSHA